MKKEPTINMYRPIQRVMRRSAFIGVSPVDEALTEGQKIINRLKFKKAIEQLEGERNV